MQFRRELQAIGIALSVTGSGAFPAGAQSPPLVAVVEREIGQGVSEIREGYFMLDVRGIATLGGRTVVASYKESKLHVFDDSGKLAYTIGQRGEGPGDLSGGQPFGPVPLEALGPHGETVVAISSEYSIRWLTPAGANTSVVRRDVHGPPVTAAERDRAEQGLANLARNLGVERSDIPFSVPAARAPLERLGFDLDGRLWVEKNTAAGATDSLGGERLVFLRWGR